MTALKYSLGFSTDSSKYLSRIQNSPAGYPQCKYDLDAFVANYKGSEKSLASDLEWIANFALDSTHDVQVRAILARDFPRALYSEVFRARSKLNGIDSEKIASDTGKIKILSEMDPSYSESIVRIYQISSHFR